MQPILFMLHGPGLGVPGRGQGLPAFLFGRLPRPPQQLALSGVTRDSSGAVLGSCVVSLYRASDDLLMERVTSDAVTGAYSFSTLGLGANYYVVAYKAGSPDVVGTTVNTLTGAGQ